jgi:hypothetical protein
MERFFAPCPRGLEPVLQAELQRLGATSLAAADGGVSFEGERELAYVVNLESRLASRVLWQVGTGRYRNEKDVNAAANAIAWTKHFRNERTLRVDVSATRSPLQSLEFATLTIKDAIETEGIRSTGGDRREGRDDKDRQPGSLDLLVKQQIPAADLGHAEIGDHQIRLRSGEMDQRLLAICGGDHLPALQREHALQTVPHTRIVIDEKNGAVVRRAARRRGNGMR